MGWTGIHATHYKRKNGKQVVDARAECDDMWSHDHGRFKVLKSAMIGSVYYAAIAICRKWEEGTEHIPENLVDISESEREVFGVVFLTSVKNSDYFNFSYKDMDETCGPYEVKCPMSIIKLLTPTDNERANEWRRNCKEYAESKKSPNSLQNLPIGTKIKYNDGIGEVILEKRAPAYQFKTPWWYNAEKDVYVSKKYIPKDFEIIR